MGIECTSLRMCDQQSGPNKADIPICVSCCFLWGDTSELTIGVCVCVTIIVLLFIAFPCVEISSSISPPGETFLLVRASPLVCVCVCAYVCLCMCVCVHMMACVWVCLCVFVWTSNVDNVWTANENKRLKLQNVMSGKQKELLRRRANKNHKATTIHKK